MFKRWECARALRRAASCCEQRSLPFAARIQSRALSHAAQDSVASPSQDTVSTYRPDWRSKDAALAAHLDRVFSPLQFPVELASRILTHASHPDAAVRHNGRLSFVGRRVLQSYLLMFIHSSPTLQSDLDYDKVLERSLNTYVLGEHVAPQWEIGKVLKWRPMNVGHHSKPLGPDIEVPGLLANVKSANARGIGMYKVHGASVEAVVGGVFHQFGGSVAHRLFHTRLLPHLCIQGSTNGLHGGYHEHALEICERMGGLKGPLLR